VSLHACASGEGAVSQSRPSSAAVVISYLNVTGIASRWVTGPRYPRRYRPFEDRVDGDWVMRGPWSLVLLAWMYPTAPHGALASLIAMDVDLLPQRAFGVGLRPPRLPDRATVAPRTGA
jgi:hypothetical protein